MFKLKNLDFNVNQKKGFLRIPFLLFFIKIFSGFTLGMTLAVIIANLTTAGTLSMVFIIVVTTSAFLKLVWYYRSMGLIFVNLLFIILFLLVKLYINISVA